MSDVFFQALMLQPPRVLGTRLLPFCLGHEYILRRLGNRFVVGGDLPGFDDLLAGLWVCSHSFEECGRFLFGDAPAFPGTRRLRRRLRRDGFDAAFDAFEVYLADYNAAPERWAAAKPGTKVFKGPWELHIVRVLCDHYGCSLSAAWNMGVGMALAYYDIFGESLGDDSLVGERDAALNDLAARIRAATEAGEMELAAELMEEAKEFCS